MSKKQSPSSGGPRRRWRTPSELDPIFDAASDRKMLASKLPRPVTEEEKRVWRFLHRLKVQILAELKKRRGY